ncbi:MAG TPA: hypothetical protein VHG28_11225 [Longimicrobiaceae bacterium]|nr:hypothetical protein [Longimicrobiaceae bacterium]
MRRSLGQYVQQSHTHRHIQLAWGGGVLVGLFNLVPGILGIAAKEPYAWGFVLEGIIYFGLSYGIYRRKLAASAVMLALFVFTRIAAGLMNGVVLTLILTYIFGRATKELWDLRAASRLAAGESVRPSLAGADPR